MTSKATTKKTPAKKPGRAQAKAPATGKAPAVKTAPFKGRVYGPTFEFASKQGEMRTRDLIEATAKATGLPVKDVGFAVAVLRIPNHPTNGGRAWNKSEKRGFTLIRAYRPTKVPAERKPKASEPAQAAEGASVA